MFSRTACVMSLAGLFLVALAACVSRADEVTDLDAGVYVQKGGAPLNVDRHSAPTVVDWNNDGMKDLLVGEFPGYVWLFINTGTDAAPVFTSGSKLKANGSDIRVAGG